MTDNANRSGVVTCMTVNEFERATLESNRYDVRVLHHKTVDTHSPAQIVLTKGFYAGNAPPTPKCKFSRQADSVPCRDVESQWNPAK